MRLYDKRRTVSKGDVFSESRRENGEVCERIILTKELFATGQFLFVFV
jgi:hypothetical protein